MHTSLQFQAQKQAAVVAGAIVWQLVGVLQQVVPPTVQASPLLRLQTGLQTLDWQVLGLTQQSVALHAPLSGTQGFAHWLALQMFVESQHSPDVPVQAPPRFLHVPHVDVLVLQVKAFIQQIVALHVWPVAALQDLLVVAATVVVVGLGVITDGPPMVDAETVVAKGVVEAGARVLAGFVITLGCRSM